MLWSECDLVARVDALGREGEMEVAAGDEAGLLEDRQHALARGAWVGRGLQDDQLAGLQCVGDDLRRADQRSEVGLAVGRERRWDADDHRVAEGEARSARRCLDARSDGLQLLGRNVLDVGLTGPQLVDARLADVYSYDALASLGERHRQGQANVAEPHDPDGHASSFCVSNSAPSLVRRPARSSAICCCSRRRSSAKSPRDVVVALLCGLELEHAVARTKLEVQRERREEVLKGLVGLSSAAKVADAYSHAAQLGAWSVGQEGEIGWGP